MPRNSSASAKKVSASSISSVGRQLSTTRKTAAAVTFAVDSGLTDQDLVFPAWDGRPQAPNAFGAMWGKAARELGLALPFHSLRHSHASQLIDTGVDVVTISKRLGHSSPAITLSVYAHLFRKDDSKAATAIDAALGG
jgi:integrase